MLYCGPVKGQALEQVKGVTYCLAEFLGLSRTCSKEKSLNAPLSVNKDLNHKDCYHHMLNDPVNNQLYQCIVYLAPGDYHRFHSPADWTVERRKHFPGELFSVNPSVARWLQGLFCLNERVVYSGNWDHGYFSMTAVGATNVGSISVEFDQALVTNVAKRYPPGHHFDVDFTRPVNQSDKGEENVEAIGTTVIQDKSYESAEKSDASNTSIESISEEPCYTQLEDIVEDMNARNYQENGDGMTEEKPVRIKEDIIGDLEDGYRVGGITLMKGDEVGRFNLGSTIVLVFEAPREFEFVVHPGQRVQYGQAVGMPCPH